MNRHPKLRIACCLCAALLLTQYSLADSDYFFDTFDDGSVADGSPVSWLAGPAPWNMGQFDVINGSYVLTTSRTPTPLPGFPDYTESDSSVIDAVFGNVSIRAKIRAQSSGAAYLSGFFARNTLIPGSEQSTGIAASLYETGLMELSLYAGSGPTDLGSFHSANRPGIRDVNLALDIIGDTARFTTWVDGADRPLSPQIEVAIPSTVSSEGGVGIFHGQVLGANNTNPLIPMAFRYFAVHPTSGVLGDFDLDAEVDENDIDLLYDHLGSDLLQYDVSGDAMVDQNDVNRLVNVILGTAFGDANLDRRVDEADFNIWQSHAFQQGTDWQSGDFNGDGLTDGADFNIWLRHRGFSSAADAVPEPAGAYFLAAAGILVLCSWRRPCVIG